MFSSENTPYIPHVAVLIILQIEGWAKEWGHGEERLWGGEEGRLGESGGGGGAVMC